MSIHNPHLQEAGFGVLGFASGTVQSLLTNGANALFSGACGAIGALAVHWFYRKFIKKKNNVEQARRPKIS